MPSCFLACLLIIFFPVSLVAILRPVLRALRLRVLSSFLTSCLTLSLAAFPIALRPFSLVANLPAFLRILRPPSLLATLKAFFPAFSLSLVVSLLSFPLTALLRTLRPVLLFISCLPTLNWAFLLALRKVEPPPPSPLAILSLSLGSIT